MRLNDAFVTANNRYPIFLLFSVNGSGHFVGVAQMKSAVENLLNLYNELIGRLRKLF